MQYLAIDEAKRLSGLRLVLTRGVPGPWSEAAKAVFRLRKVDFHSVEQRGGGANTELVAWTGHRNAPIAIFDNEPARVRWQEILDLAERLGSGPSLYPAVIEDRILMTGIASEICNEGGLAWQARMLMLNMNYQTHGHVVFEKNPMYREYQFSEKAVRESVIRIEEILEMLTTRIKAQQEKGSIYIVGETLSAVDVYWAYFSNMLQALPAQDNPMPENLREAWGALAAGISSYDPVLIEQRNQIFTRHLSLPLEF